MHLKSRSFTPFHSLWWNPCGSQDKQRNSWQNSIVGLYNPCYLRISKGWAWPGGGLPVWDELLLLKDYFHKIFSIYALPVPTPIFSIISVEKELSQLFPTLLSAGSFALFPTLRVRPPELRGEVHCHGHDEGNPSDSSEEVQSAHNERQRPEQHPEEQWLVHAPHRKAASAGDGFYTQEKHRRGSGG